MAHVIKKMKREAFDTDTRKNSKRFSKRVDKLTLLDQMASKELAYAENAAWI